MNQMNEVAKLLGVKLNEEFKIKGISDIYMITENGITTKNGKYAQGLILTQLIAGQLEIQKYPWKPQSGERFYYVAFGDELYVRYDDWTGFNGDILCYKIGNCYRSYEDAFASIPKWVDFFKNDKVFTYA